MASYDNYPDFVKRAVMQSVNQAQAGQRNVQEDETRKAAMVKRRAGIQAAYQQAATSPGPTELKAEATPTGALPQFDAMRARAQKRIQSQGLAQQQTQQDAMQRRLAAAGALNSGGGIKALDTARTQSDQRIQEATQDAVEGIDAQEAQQRAQMDEAVKGRNFQRDQFNEEQRFRDKVFRADTFAKFQELENQLENIDLSQIQMKLQREESAFNQRMARYQAGRQGGFFGAGGFLGLGLGATDAEI